MILRVPSYYKEFRCIADRCQDSCCIGWEIDIDEETFSYYENVEGAFGERLRAHMATEDTNSFVLQENGWCPFLNAEKLCDICIVLGEEALSEVCTEFPRFTMEYENVREKILSLSCEEVGRLLFSSKEKITWEEQKLAQSCAAFEFEGIECGEEEACLEDDEGYADMPKLAALRLEEVRKKAVELLEERTKPVFERMAEYLAYCNRMQQEIYGGKSSGNDRCVAGEDGAEKERAYRDFCARMECFSQLEVLDGTWTKVMEALYDTFTAENYLRYRKEFLETLREREYEYEHLLVYFTFRYFMRAYYDDNILTKAQFAVASVLMIRDMDVLRYVQNGGSFTLSDRIDDAKIYSKEVEHSEENMELLAEAFQFEEIFQTERMMEQI